MSVKRYLQDIVREARPPGGADPFVPGAEGLEIFAAFLRANGRIWRTRRLDRFTPVDFHLVEQSTKIQGKIDASFIEYFSSVHGAEHPEARWSLRQGDVATLLLPALAQPKQMLLNFTSRGPGGESLVLLTRPEGTVASASYHFGTLCESAAADPQGEAVDHLMTVLVALMFQNPHSLGERLQALRPDLGVSDPLSGNELVEWVRAEANAFSSRVGDALVSNDGTRASITEAAKSGVPIPDELRFGGLCRFGTINELLWHAIADVLRVFAYLEPPWRSSDSSRPRLDFVTDVTSLASRLERDLVGGMKQLHELLSDWFERDLAEMRAHADTAPDVEYGMSAFLVEVPATSDLLRSLDSWTAYALATIRVGEPFALDFTQSLPIEPQLSRREEYRRASAPSRFEFPVAWGDARAIHVEVSLDDPELRFARRWDQLAAVTTATGMGGSRRVTGGLATFFDARLRASGQLVHFYAHRDDPEVEDLTAPIRLLVAIRLTRTVIAGYAFASLAIVTAASYLGYQWMRWAVGGRAVNGIAVTTVTALTITLTLWLTTAQGRRPVVHKKLINARLVISSAIGLTLLYPVAWLVIRGGRDASGLAIGITIAISVVAAAGVVRLWTAWRRRLLA